MSRAEEAALKAYPKETRDKTGFVTDTGCPQFIRDYYIQGYEQAERDLALTIDDLRLIEDIHDDVYEEYKKSGKTGIYSDEYYKEVLRRYNEEKL